MTQDLQAKLRECEKEGEECALKGNERWTHPYSWDQPPSPTVRKAMVAAFHKGYDSVKK